MINKWLILFTITVISPCFAGEAPSIIYLTFEEEETWESVTINFHTAGLIQPGVGKVYYDTVTRNGEKDKYALQEAARVDILHKKNRTIHHAKLNQLTPNTTYYFVAGSDETGYSPEMKFKTLPNDGTPIRMMVGGDMDVSPRVTETSRYATTQEHDVILLGGDLAYATWGPYRDFGRWEQWFDLLKPIATSPSGHLIPLIVAIGNHEVTTGFSCCPFVYHPWTQAPYFFEFFPQQPQPPIGPKKTFFTKKLGNHTALIVLDTSHYHRHIDQRYWLELQLRQYQNLPNRIALYHAPLYPNSRGEDDPYTTRGREHWEPLFDQFNLTAAFEHHEHTFKRTFPIRNDATQKIGETVHDPSGKKTTLYREGTVYIGNGCWGRYSREHDPHRWYLAKSSSDYHVWSVEASASHLEMMASGAGGQIFDHIKVITPSNGTTQIEEFPLPSNESTSNESKPSDKQQPQPMIAPLRP